jgi:hypothetical protein
MLQKLVTQYLNGEPPSWEEAGNLLLEDKNLIEAHALKLMPKEE